jgi:hypothetical protein
LLRNSGRCVNVPLPPSRVVLDSPTPLDDTALLADVDFLARSNQSNHYTPLGYAVRELDEEFWLGPVGASVLVSDLYHFRIERSLCLVIDQHVFGRNPPVVAGIRFYVVLYVAYENATTAAGIS